MCTRTHCTDIHNGSTYYSAVCQQTIEANDHSTNVLVDLKVGDLICGTSMNGWCDTKRLRSRMQFSPLVVCDRKKGMCFLQLTSTIQTLKSQGDGSNPSWCPPLRTSRD